MELAVIQLDRDDDFVSIRDRLSWIDARRVILVTPPNGRVLAQQLDLALVRRLADREEIEIGIVTADSRTLRQARDVGLPAFGSLSAARGNRGRRTWWRARARPAPGLPDGAVPISLDEGDRSEVQRRLSPPSTRRVWLLRYAAIAVFVAVITLLATAVTYALPTATITLYPIVEPVRMARQVVADPQLESVNFSGASVPARRMSVTVQWQATAATSGEVEIPDAPARGTILFVNLLDEAVSVPAGTRVRATSGSDVTFQTLRAVDVPPLVGSTAAVDIVAIAPGSQGNLPANTVNRIEGPLALRLEARNLEPTEGGAVRIAAAVVQSDHDRLRAQVLQFLQALAASEMAGSLTTDEFLPPQSLRVVAIHDETYSHFVGEQANTVTLAMRAELQGTAVDASQANGLIYEAIREAVVDGFSLVPDSLRFERGEVIGADNQGRVTFVMLGEGRVAADFATGSLLDDIAGQPADIATIYLFEQLPQRTTPTIDIWPGWFGRVPYLPSRLRTILDTGAS